MTEDPTSGPADVGAEQRWLALHSIAGWPPPPATSRARRVELDHVTVLLTSMPSLTIVEPDALAPEHAGEATGQVADLLRSHGRSQAAWNIEVGDPLLAALEALGFTPYTDAPLEPEYAALVMDREPQAGNPDADVHVIGSLSDVEDVVVLMAEDSGLSAADTAAMRQSLLTRFENRDDSGTGMVNYVAYLDGECVGEAGAARGPRAWYLSGATVVPQARGRGIYQALTRRRWDDAVAAGTPLLTVHAGRMSRPRLEKLGFRLAAEVVVRCQRI